MESNDNKQLVKKGEVLVVQGQIPKFIFYLQNGAVEILAAPKEFEGLDPAIIVQKSKRVGYIKDKLIFSGLSIELTDSSTKTIKAAEDSYITKLPLPRSGIAQLASDDPATVINLLTYTYKLLEQAISDDTNYSSLYSNICKLNDNISLMYKSLPGFNISEKFQNKSNSLFQVFNDNGGSIAGEFDAKFLILDNSKYLRKRYAFPGMPVQSIIDPKQCSLIKKFLSLEKGKFIGIIRDDPSIIQYMIEIITDNVLKVFDRIYAIHNEIDTELETLFGRESWSSFLTENNGFSVWSRSGNISGDFIMNFLQLVKKLHSYYNKISGKNLVDLFPGPKKIHQYYMSNKGNGADNFAEVSGSSENNAADNKPSINTAALSVYKNSLRQIFEFALVNKDFQKIFSKNLNDFRTMNNPFSTEVDGRKIRRAITKQYWELFSQVFIRMQKEKKIPPPVKMMMKFGFLDETLLEDNQVSELHELLNIYEENTDYPILHELDFLTEIYKGNVNPSITEMGLSYENFKREEAKKGARVLKSVSQTGNEVDKTIFEIQHRLSQTVAVCSGSTSTAFPILTSMTMKINPKTIYVSISKLKSAIKELMDIDYSVFYRETTLKLGIARELIQEEVIPYFILIPSFGTKAMFWQDLDGTNRRTKGRLVIPVFFLGDMVKNLAHTFATFRWELNRTLKGGLWADPVEGGVTGAYFDYINFYKKNSKLSGETKDRITERFKTLRTNRDRFADDYAQWMLYEKDGIMRLNTVVREIFYRHIPFKKEIREKLEGMPAFSEIANRYKNIHTKSVDGYERKFKKYIDDSGNLPDKLQEFMDFLNY